MTYSITLFIFIINSLINSFSRFRSRCIFNNNDVVYFITNGNNWWNIITRLNLVTYWNIWFKCNIVTFFTRNNLMTYNITLFIFIIYSLCDSFLRFRSRDIFNNYNIIYFVTNGNYRWDILAIFNFITRWNLWCKYYSSTNFTRNVLFTYNIALFIFIINSLSFCSMNYIKCSSTIVKG